MARTSEALVVGGGPVGLFAALSLLEQGVSVEIVDAGGARPVRGYACGMHPETLRMFDRLGLLPALLADAHRIDRVVVQQGASKRGTAEFSRLDGGFPYVLTLRQTELEELLEEALTRRGVRVSREHAVSEVLHHDGFVRVTARSRPAGTHGRKEALAETVVHDAAFVVGADGYSSTCRHALGVDLLALQPSKAFGIYEFLADLRGWEREARIVLDEDCASAFWPLGPNLGRWTFELGEHLDEAPSLDRLRALLRERAPGFAPEPEQLCWGATTYFENWVARRFGNTRLWLAGDAAHSTSPIGFQSMNRGFCEAEALTRLIASALHDRHPRAGAFAQFELEQQREWRRLFDLEPGTSQQPQKNTSLAPCIPASGADFAALVAQLDTALA
jgi:2-polyprenyl-6-methoxyphenol hydroxylase-like FAD-dependent oxidoreductase